MKRIVSPGFSVAVVLLSVGLSRGKAPDDFSFQGRLTDAEGNPVDTIVTIESRLYAGATLLHEQTHNAVEVVNGIFNLVDQRYGHGFVRRID